MRLSIPVLLSLALSLAACGKSPQNPPPPAAATTPDATSAPASAAAPGTAPVAAAASAPAAGSAPAAVTSSAVAGVTTVAPGEATTAGPEVAGQVALADGNVTDTAKDGSSRQLKDGDAVYPGDSFVLGQDSYLDLDLEDTGRILLRPNTTFQITSYHYEADAHDVSATDANGQPLIKPQQPENAFFKLVKGGLRAIDGVIGHTTPQNYGVETPVATIGVRGTAFDVRYCGDDCADEADTSGKPDNGLYTSVSEGSVGVKNDSGETLTKAGQSGFVKSRKEKQQALTAPPKALRHMDLPEKLQPRANTNRSNLRVKRQKRREIIQQRRRAAVAKAKTTPPGKAAPAALKPGAKDQKPETPAERRQERREQKQEKRAGKTAAPAAVTQGKAERLQKRGEKLRQQEHEPAAATPIRGNLKPAGQSGETGPTPRQQLREKRQERRQEKQQAEKPVPAAATAAPTSTKGKADKPAAGDDKCKDKKKRKKADKDKDKCGGD
jgi:hypothetical protein